MHVHGKKMKIVHFNDFENYAGAETAIKMMMDSLKTLGIESRLYTREDVGGYQTSATEKRARCLKILQKEQPDVVHLHNTSELSLVPAQVAIKNKIPIVWTLHDYRAICPNTLLFRPNKTICKEKQCSSCDRKIMVIDSEYDTFLSLLKKAFCVVASDYVREKYRGTVETTRIYWDADTSLLNQPTISSFNSRDILFGGRKDCEKGTVFAITALKRILKKHGNARLLFAGTSRNDQIMEIANVYNVKDHVADLGYLPRKKYLDVVQSVNCVMCVSIWEEPFNLTLLEAMASGKPVISTRVGGQTEVAGNAGVTVDSKSSIAISNAVDKLFSDKTLHEELSRLSKERASSFKGCAEQYIAIYKKAVDSQTN